MNSTPEEITFFGGFVFVGDKSIKVGCWGPRWFIPYFDCPKEIEDAFKSINKPCNIVKDYYMGFENYIVSF